MAIVLKLEVQAPRDRQQWVVLAIRTLAAQGTREALEKVVALVHAVAGRIGAGRTGLACHITHQGRLVRHVVAIELVRRGVTLPSDGAHVHAAKAIVVGCRTVQDLAEVIGSTEPGIHPASDIATAAAAATRHGERGFGLVLFSLGWGRKGKFHDDVTDPASRAQWEAAWGRVQGQ